MIHKILIDFEFGFQKTKKLNKRPLFVKNRTFCNIELQKFLTFFTIFINDSEKNGISVKTPQARNIWMINTITKDIPVKIGYFGYSRAIRLGTLNAVKECLIRRFSSFK